MGAGLQLSLLQQCPIQVKPYQLRYFTVKKFGYRENAIMLVQGARNPISYVKVPMANGFDCPQEMWSPLRDPILGKAVSSASPLAISVASILTSRPDYARSTNHGRSCAGCSLSWSFRAKGLIFSPNLECPFFRDQSTLRAKRTCNGDRKGQ